MAILWIPIVSIVGAALHWDWYFIKEMSEISLDTAHRLFKLPTERRMRFSRNTSYCTPELAGLYERTLAVLALGRSVRILAKKHAKKQGDMSIIICKRVIDTCACT